MKTSVLGTVEKRLEASPVESAEKRIHLEIASFIIDLLLVDQLVEF